MRSCSGVSKALCRVSYIMGFLDTPLLSWSSCPCMSIFILLRVFVDYILISQSDISADVRISISHSVSIEFLSLSILILFSTSFNAFHRNFSLGALGSYSYINIPFVTARFLSLAFRWKRVVAYWPSRGISVLPSIGFRAS